jgi:tRNA A-37 threonylcarbamoyl transferase component Bud32
VDTQPNPSIRVKGFRIEALIGRGGMGQVYRAKQLNLDRKVALKVLAPELAADHRFRHRFLRESRIAAGIDHPNVIPIYEAGEDDGVLYLAMRYVEGFDLATLLEREGRLDPTRTMAIMSQVADALDVAHARGLVHRDVKPANVLLAPAAPGSVEHCYLCDFGLIKEMDAETALTATDQFVGTVPYVAPEQIEGRTIDGRTDVYSLGCVIFQCLTGSVPYEGKTDVEVVFAHLRDPPPLVSSRVLGLPAALDGILARAMAKAKEDRYPTCSALVAAVAGQVRGGGGTRGPLVDDKTRSMVQPPVPMGASPPAAVARTDPIASRPAPQPARPPAPAAASQPAPRAAPPGRPAIRPARRAPGQRWLTVLALVLVPVLAYLAAVQVFARARPEGSEPSPPLRADVTPGPTGGTRPTCAGGWIEPQVGTPPRQAPLNAIRAQRGWTGTFRVPEMRYFTGPDEVERWYVKAYQEDDPSLRGRWLVEEQRDGERRVVAEAPYDTRGYRPADWRAVSSGYRGLPAAAAGCLAGA